MTLQQRNIHYVALWITLSLLLGACASEEPELPPAAPRVIGGTDTVRVDERVTVTVVSEDEHDRPLTYEVDWGDERGLQTIPGVVSGLFVELEWQYFDPGSYAMRCRVVNADGRISAWSEQFRVHVLGESRIGQGDWWMFMRDPQHSGHSRFQGPSIPVEKWRYEGASPIRSSAVYDIAGSAYFGSDEFLLHAFYGDGRSKWRYWTGTARIPNAPALAADGSLYFGSSSANIYRVSRYGKKLWNYSVNSPILSASATLDTRGRVYIGSEDHTLYCLDSNGQLEWRVFTNGPIRGGPALSQDESRIYIGSADHLLYAVDRDGGVDWTAVSGGPLVGSPSVGGNGTIYIGCEDQFLYAYRPDGSLRWKRDLRSPIRTTPAVTRDGRICVATLDGRMFCLDETGSELWSTSYALAGGEGSPAVDIRGSIYIGSPDGNLTALSANGRILWRFETDWPIHSSPTIGQDGSVAFGNDGGFFIVLRER